MKSYRALDESVCNLLRSAVSRIVGLSDLYESTRKALEDAGVRRAVVVAFGKGSVSMAKAAIDVLDVVEGGVVVVPKWMDAPVLEGLEVVKSSHPIPDDSSVAAGEAVLEWARSSGGKGLMALVSGGGSALVEVPQEGLTIDDIAEANKVLLGSGAGIYEINTVRKHLSMVKGGWLAKATGQGPVYGYYASDVPGDDLSTIASGPTVPDPTTYKDALDVLDFYGIRDDMPESVVKVLTEGAEGKRPETPKPDDPVFRNTRNILVAANIDLLERLGAWLSSQGYRVLILTSRLEGDSIEVGKALASITIEAYTRGVPLETPLAILYGGETTVRLEDNSGLGGRNQELVLSWIITVDKWLSPGAPVGILSMDTDGIDGNSPAAGAIACAGTTRVARSKGIVAEDYLLRHDSYRFFRELDLAVVTGPTGSNLNSLGIIIIK